MADENAVGTGSVTTPATPQKPTGAYWDRLEKCVTVADCQTLEAELVTHKYEAGGQLRTALTQKMVALAKLGG